MFKDDKENTARWLKHRSQVNRTHRFQQLELDFGPDFECYHGDQPDWKLRSNKEGK